ncbi:hypothetical protein CFAM422_007055 [Trichoderma lentiforme]|uniref:Uncharacterized protein n=1 Tax=Trichoderma lentiforme TaxID=1567552 RepID=A0A9P4XDW5_9HYPO|nr:hypothetical protein CFAM422_007055 [Trichoderma lentiforme]
MLHRPAVGLDTAGLDTGLDGEWQWHLGRFTPDARAAFGIFRPLAFCGLADWPSASLPEAFHLPLVMVRIPPFVF